MNTAKLYELMQQLIEHKRMEDELHDMIRAEMDVKVGQVHGSHIFGKRQIIEIEPQLARSGYPMRWVLRAKLTMGHVKRDGSMSVRKSVVLTKSLVEDWLCTLPAASERRPTVEEVAEAQQTGDRAMAAFVNTFSHGRELVERKPDRRRQTDRRKP